jgi:hypothetical protein
MPAPGVESASARGYTRRAAHSAAGGWYCATGAGADLAAELDALLDAAPPGETAAPCAVVSPHAGLRYSGATAAHAFARARGRLPPALRRVVILGPSHHVHVENGLLLCAAGALATPLGDLPAALPAPLASAAALRAAGLPGSREMTREEDEAEHSVEMQLPFVARLLQAQNLCAVEVGCVLVGQLDADAARALGAALAPLLADPAANFLVISSDFCHWGARFRFAPTFEAEAVPLERTWVGIERLDRRAMALVEARALEPFLLYLRETRNSICGRHPIAGLLAALELLEGAAPAPAARFALTFVRYAQSSRVSSLADSSVSYAAAVVLAPAPP